MRKMQNAASLYAGYLFGKIFDMLWFAWNDTHINSVAYIYIRHGW